MKQKKFDRRNLKASKSLNRFDLSNREILSAPFGMLVPCAYRHLVGGSKVRIELEHQIRCNMLKAPAFSRLRQHFDYFFVPYSQIWRRYDNLKTQQSNLNSALFSQQNRSIPTGIPYFNGQDIHEILYDFENESPDDVNGYNSAYGTRRLLDLLGYGNIPLSGIWHDVPYLNSQIRLNPFALCAYQKIYYDYYRNDKYEDNDPSAYNIDDFGNSDEIDVARLRKISTIRYRWRRKDYFTQVTPDLLPSNKLYGYTGFVGDLTVQGEDRLITDGDALRQFNLPGSYPRNIDINQGQSITNPDVIDTKIVSNTAGSNIRFTSNLFGLPSATDAIQNVPIHRLSVARQKLLERMYAAHSDFSSQMLAIFGYSPTEGRFGNVKHIGGFSDIIQIADVDNTTAASRSTENSVFGKINNVNSHERYLDYDVPEDGILMCIFSTDILQDYDSYRLDRFNFKTFAEDFFNPYYEGLGKQALYSVEYSTLSYDTENQDYVPTSPSVIGFVPRYSEYKHQIDCVHGEFCKFGTKNYMSAPTNSDYIRQHPYLFIKNLVLNPNQLDSIVPVPFDGSEATDCFDLNLYHSVKVLAPMTRESEL